MQADSAAKVEKIRETAAATAAALDKQRRDVLAAARQKIDAEEARLAAEVQAARESLEEVTA